MTAYNGENNAHVRYMAFSKKADEEGYGEVASLFRAAAAAEKVHFERHAEIIESLAGKPAVNIETPDVKSTKENLDRALKGESYERDTMYPEFLKQAEQEMIPEAADAFEDARAAEAVHAQLYENAIASLESMKAEKKDLYVCPKCGNIVETITDPNCEICNTETIKFMKVN